VRLVLEWRDRGPGTGQWVDWLSPTVLVPGNEGVVEYIRQAPGPWGMLSMASLNGEEFRLQRGEVQVLADAGRGRWAYRPRCMVYRVHTLGGRGRGAHRLDGFDRGRHQVLGNVCAGDPLANKRSALILGLYTNVRKAGVYEHPLQIVE